MEKEINVLAMIKGDERYVFFYDEENRVETLRTLGRYAADPDLSFSWYDAAVMSKKIRDMANGDVSEHSSRHHLQDTNPRFSFRHEPDTF